MPAPLNILWLKSGPLHPLDTGGKIRTHSMLTEISKHHQVTYLAFKDSKQDLHSDEKDALYAQQKIWIPWQEAQSGSLRFFKELIFNLFSSLPYALAKYQSTAMQQQILQLDASGQFDLILCDFLVPAPNIQAIHSQLHTPTILFQHNIESEIWRRLRDTKSNPLSKLYFQLQYQRMLHWEQKLSRQFNGIITVSPNDTDFCHKQYHLQNILGEVPTGVDINFFHPAQPSSPKEGTSARQAALSPSHPDSSSPASAPQLRRDKQPKSLQPTASPHIAFLGSMDWMPNIECVQYFTHQVLPLILDPLPDTRFVIIGRNPAPAVRELAANNPAIELTGSVEDIRPHLQKCDLMVVPLRAGGGTRIKIFESMAMGVPVISTTIGAEGLPVTDQKDILIADDEQSLANACIQLLQNPELAQQIATAARQKVAQDHSWKAVSEQFIELCHNT